MNTHSNCIHCNNRLEEWECELLRISPVRQVVTGEFFVGVSPDNVNKEKKFRYKSAAKAHARRCTEFSGIQFYVYEQVSTFKPVS